ncbi:MAG: MATE family efflux transporter [bacterium]|jgi:putative MATE family efflux protein
MAITEGNLRRTVLSLSWPAVTRMSFNMLVQVVDLIMVGRLGATAIAAVGVSNQIFFLTIAVVSAFGIGATALIAQAVGAGDISRGREVARQALIFTGIATSSVTLIGYFGAERLINAALILNDNPDPEILHLATTYLRIVSLSIFLRFYMMVVNNILQGTGDMKTPLFIVIFANVFNAIGNYLLIYGIGPFPQLGVAGAAIATALAGVLGGLMGIGSLFHPRCLIQLSLRDSFRIQLPVIKDILRLGVPAALEQGVVHGSQMLYTVLAAGLGDTALAANQIMMTANSMTNHPCIGFSAVSTTLVGQNLGAGNIARARASGYETQRWAVLFTTLVGILFFTAPELVVRAFTSDQQVIPLAGKTLRVLGLAQPALATALILAGGLRGAGDTRYVMYITALGMLGFRLAFTLIFLSLGWGLPGLWGAAALEAYLRGSLIMHRFTSGHWAEDYSRPRPSQSLAK